MPSFWSAVANTAWERRRSKRTRSASVALTARATASFAVIETGNDIPRHGRGHRECLAQQLTGTTPVREGRTG
jgi:hypothetical protein